MSNSVLQAEKLSKSFTSPSPLVLFADISLTVQTGQSVAIIGRSGEGKTTLLHILGSLDEPTTGTLSILGSAISAKNSHFMRNRHIGFVFQAFHLLDDATVLENILLPLAIARSDLKEHLGLAQKLLERLGLEKRQHLPALKLSGGEKQRLAIGRAFITNPDIILADEPTGNLDHQTALEVQELLFSWVKEQNKALLVVTHSHELAKQCDVIYRLESGRLCPIND